MAAYETHGMSAPGCDNDDRHDSCRVGGNRHAHGSVRRAGGSGRCQPAAGRGGNSGCSRGPCGGNHRRTVRRAGGHDCRPRGADACRKHAGGRGDPDARADARLCPPACGNEAVRIRLAAEGGGRACRGGRCIRLRPGRGQHGRRRGMVCRQRAGLQRLCPRGSPPDARRGRNGPLPGPGGRSRSTGAAPERQRTAGGSCADG